MPVTVHRVVVRGQFADLRADQRAALLAEADDHEIFKATYTPWGSFTYEPNLVSFSFRYEVRATDGEAGDDAADPAAIGLAKATASLQEWDLGFKHLRSSATDMGAMWSASDEGRG